MNQKILRVGLAMGGGTSLGTFCGFGLSQALKLLIVYGRDSNSLPYKRVVVDVFSGASAGALSLGAMLRFLVYQSDQRLIEAEGKVKQEFGMLYNQLSDENKKDLVAAQVVQDMQVHLWSKEISLDKLLPDDGAASDLRFKASILDRSAVDDIARRHLVQWRDADDQAPQAIDFTRRRMLADRVLYACTLANLTPMIADARAEYPGREVGFMGLNDGMRSRTHRDMRVFDLNFTERKHPEDDRFPDRWCLYHTANAVDKMIGDLGQRSTWAKIAATAVASGAFPLAFEPVPLPRKAFEYGPQLWNKTFYPTGNRQVPFDGSEEQIFSFVDGGVFNNEPVREAFRLASFIDSHRRLEEPDEEWERLIVAVDPAVSTPTINCSVPILRRWILQKPNQFGSLDGFDLRRAGSLDRLLPHIGSLIGLLKDQGRVREADKIFQIRDAMKLRDGIRETLNRTLISAPTDGDFVYIYDFCVSQLKRTDTDEVVPPGPASVLSEVERVLAEEGLHNQDYKNLRGLFHNFLATIPDPATGKAATTLLADQIAASESAALWLRVFSFVAVDLILGLEGKLDLVRLVAIAPFKDLQEFKGQDGTTMVQAKAIPLPGGQLAGFAGFMSDIPDRLDYLAAKYCAAEFLAKCGCIDPLAPRPDISALELSAADKQRLESDIQRGLDLIVKRIERMVKQSHLIQVFPLIDSALNLLARKAVAYAMKGAMASKGEKTMVELRVEVPNERFELDGQGLGDHDSKPVHDFPRSPLELITIAEYDWDNKIWSGGFVKEGRFLDIDEDGTAFLPDKDFCELELPDEAGLLRTARSPNATFCYKLSEADRGTKIGAQAWELRSGVVALEDALM